MTAIEIASTTNGAASAGAKPKASEAGRDGGFSAIFDSVARKPAHELADERTGGSRPAAGKPAQPGDGRVGARHPVQRGADLTGRTQAADDRGSDGEDAPPDAADAADDLTLLLGIGAPAAPAAGGAPAAQPSTPLRRDVLPQPPNATNATDSDQPGQTVRLVVIGRETHFAPVVARAPGHAAVTGPAQPEASLPETAAADAEAKPARAKPANAPSLTAKGAEEPPRDTAPTGTATGSAAAVAVDAGPSETGALVRVADQIITQARELNAAANMAAAAGAGTPPPEGGGPVRILRLQLQPEHLGLVTARLRIVGGVLELRLTADRQQSVEVLKQDREGLIEALRRAGYKAEIASIEFARLQTPPQAPAQAPGQNNSGQSFSQDFAGQQGGSASGNPEHAPHGGGSGNGAAGGKHPDEHAAGGKDDTATQRSHEPQAVYL